MASRNVLDIKKAARKKPRQKSVNTAPVSLKQKPQRLRDKRRKQRIVAFCICLLSAAGLVGGLGAASHAERLTIHEVTVSGTEAVSDEIVRTEAQKALEGRVYGIFAKDSIFLYPKTLLRSTIETSLPRIKSAHISRDALLAQAITVSIEERQPFARWCDESCYFLDSDGYIFADDATGSPQTPYVFRGGLIIEASPIGQHFLRGRIDAVVTFLRALERAQFQPIGITVLNERDFLVPLSAGASLIVPFDADAGRIIHNLETALKADALTDALGNLEYIDLRFGNRVYYKTDVE